MFNFISSIGNYLVGKESRRVPVRYVDSVSKVKVNKTIEDKYDEHFAISIDADILKKRLDDLSREDLSAKDRRYLSAIFEEKAQLLRSASTGEGEFDGLRYKMAEKFEDTAKCLLKVDFKETVYDFAKRRSNELFNLPRNIWENTRELMRGNIINPENLEAVLLK